jgi:hypothetical protein
MVIRTPLLLVATWLCAGCARARTPPHGSGVAREALSNRDFAWRTAEAEGIHLHYLPGGLTARRAPELARTAATALRYDRMLADLPRPQEPVELFLVESREQARRLTGTGPMGQAIPGELTVFIVMLPDRPPAFRHEIMHALTLKLWGMQRRGSWLQEGVATWAGGGCHGYSVDAVAAGFLRDGTLPTLDRLREHFWEIDELHGYFTAGSAVAFVERAGGPHALRLLWESVPPASPHPLGTGGAEMEAAWRRHLATVPPATIDPERLRQHGCQTP